MISVINRSLGYKFGILCRQSNRILQNNQYLFTNTRKSSKMKMKTESVTRMSVQKSKQYSNLQIGLYGILFACCFAAIPFYRVFCEHMGLIGNNDQKTYQFKNKQIVNVKKYLVKFQGHPEPGINWEFEPVEKQVLIGTSETAIVFYRLRNKENRPIVGFSTYTLYPEEVNLYFSKIQCFCFNQQMINPEQQLLLPLFFYLQPQMIEDPDVSRINEISVSYQFNQSKNQDLAKFAAEQLKRIDENKRKLNQIRAKKRQMTLQQYEDYLEEKQQKQRLEVAELGIDLADPTTPHSSSQSPNYKQKIQTS